MSVAINPEITCAGCGKTESEVQIVREEKVVPQTGAASIHAQMGTIKPILKRYCAGCSEPAKQFRYVEVGRAAVAKAWR